MRVANWNCVETGVVAMVGRKDKITEQNSVLPLLCSWKSKWLEPSDSASMLRSLNEKTPSDTYSHINRSGQTAEAGNAGALEKSSHITNILFKYINKGQGMFQVEIDLLQELTTVLREKNNWNSD